MRHDDDDPRDDEDLDPAEDDRGDEVDLRRPRRDLKQEDKQMAMFAHLGGIIGGFLVPLIIWTIKKDTSRFVDDQGKEALNFQITLMLAHLICGVVVVATCGLGFPLTLALLVLGIVYSCLGASAANRGESYRYPSWSLRLIK